MIVVVLEQPHQRLVSARRGMPKTAWKPTTLSGVAPGGCFGVGRVAGHDGRVCLTRCIVPTVAPEVASSNLDALARTSLCIVGARIVSLHWSAGIRKWRDGPRTILCRVPDPKSSRDRGPAAVLLALEMAQVGLTAV